MITCTRRIQFCAGHRVMGHESKCAHLHGHNYVALLTAQTTADQELDGIGRVVDFAVLKERVGGWIDKNWDHGFLLHQDDSAGWAALDTFDRAAGMTQKVWSMPTNPTAENMADYLLSFVGPSVLGDTGVELVAVRVWETENCYADATP